jgi:hypothetical protein
MTRFLVTYIVHEGDYHLLPQFSISDTDDFDKNLRSIVGRRGILKKLVRHYENHNFVDIPQPSGRIRQVISHIHIQPLPEEDEAVLWKYFWPVKILARLSGY